MAHEYDAILIVSFGGPEGPDDVLPFLENVLQGKNVPRERILDVAAHYHRFGCISPINGQNRALVAALEQELAEHGPRLPVYWGNRNWHPFLRDTLQQMRDDGIRCVLAFVTSAYSSYSSCRQYQEDIELARRKLGNGAPVVDKLRVFYNHPNFIQAIAERVQEALDAIPGERREGASIAYTAHSIPLAMAQGCQYASQLLEACRLVSDRVGPWAWQLVYQSRSGPPSQAWLEPDVGDHLRRLKESGKAQDVVVVPIGFLSDHMEVVFDLDTEARELCDRLGINMVRAGTVGTHPKFLGMIRELVLERLTADAERRATGKHGPSHDACPHDCCPSGINSA